VGGDLRVPAQTRICAATTVDGEKADIEHREQRAKRRRTVVKFG